MPALRHRRWLLPAVAAACTQPLPPALRLCLLSVAARLLLVSDASPQLLLGLDASSISLTKSKPCL